MVDGHLALLSIPSKENDPILSLEMWAGARALGEGQRFKIWRDSLQPAGASERAFNKNKHPEPQTKRRETASCGPSFSRSRRPSAPLCLGWDDGMGSRNGRWYIYNA
jgi:hypothetical protein